jgi:hypothetical protein
MVTAIVLATQAFALTLSYNPSPSDLDDLPHNRFYKWGIDVSAFSGMTINEVELKLISIRNWNDGENHLYLHLLDNGPLGITGGYDSDDDFIDIYAGSGPLIADYQDLIPGSTPETVVYTFSTLGLLGTAALYIEDGVLAIGVDPDCHYYNCGIELIIKGEPTNALEVTSWGRIKAMYR